MITYDNRVYGFSILTRFHGSAAYKSITPAIASTSFYVLFYYLFRLHEAKIFDHPYPMGALMSAFTFLLIFKANFSYGRYWEAVTSVHNMHSKWLDVAMNMTAFHLQSDIYKNKPPSFGQHPEIRSLSRDRSYVPTDDFVRTTLIHQPTVMPRHKKLNIPQIDNPKNQEDTQRDEEFLRHLPPSNRNSRKFPGPIHPGDPRTERPSLFLQEAAHLLSLLSAVAMSTLRNDVEAAESPLATFRCGAPWPAVDPDSPHADIRRRYAAAHQQSHVGTIIRYLLGMTRTDRDRTMYNAARPFRVVGGVSDAEIELLQAARGPFAKVALVTVWLEEFMCREFLQGSAGLVGAPILSRNFQFLSDGMMGYNQARKIAYVPFPFPHAQITSLFVLVVIVYIPVLMLTFVSHPALGASLNFFTVMCFAGLHEVSRELENPFQNVPNDVPLNNFQAQYNEALMNMFTGYHPDGYWLTEKDTTV